MPFHTVETPGNDVELLIISTTPEREYLQRMVNMDRAVEIGHFVLRNQPSEEEYVTYPELATLKKLANNEWNETSMDEEFARTIPLTLKEFIESIPLDPVSKDLPEWEPRPDDQQQNAKQEEKKIQKVIKFTAKDFPGPALKKGCDFS